MAGAFVFANSIRTIYESVVFLFVVHPFDVGDGILIGTGLDYYIVSPQPPAPLPSSLPLLASVQVCGPHQNQHPVCSFPANFWADSNCTACTTCPLRPSCVSLEM